MVHHWPAVAMTPTVETGPRIGPNSVLQSLRALEELEGQAVAQACAERAGLPPALPSSMIPEAWFVRLVDAIHDTLPATHADVVLTRAGRHTAEYVRTHRIPLPVRWLLRCLPVRLGLPMFLHAIGKHAWTFAGAGRFRVEGPFPGTIVLDHGPCCRTRGPGPGASYYAAAFEGLLALVSSRLRVHEVACAHDSGAPGCRFSISWAPQAP
jgi:divinyl protochlorophyllide a 8-vinyl-reductase